MGLNKLAEMCEKCNYKNDCDSKRMAACAYIEEPSMLSQLTQESMQPIAQPMLQTHNYRKVKIGENTVITIDLEELKQKLINEHYKQIGCPSLNYMA